MKEYTYASEGGLIVYLKNYQILQQGDLIPFAESQSLFTEATPCNIYFVLKRPKVTVVPNSLKINPDNYSITFSIQQKDKSIERIIALPKSKTNTIELETEYPYTIFTLSIDGKPYLRTKAGTFLDLIQKKHPDHSDSLLDYEVLYIGQAIGKDGKRTAIERLLDHSTLQLIYYEAMTRNPDCDIWLMLTYFEQKNVASTSGRITIPKESEEGDLNRFIKFNDPYRMAISDRQRINYTEAALINCFKPQYNMDFKGTFPSKKHVSYSDCYNLDLNGIGIEMETSDINRWLYTEDKPRQQYDSLYPYWQHEDFHFVTSKERYKMFNNDYF
jgi:hypothetical protein